MPKNLKRWPVGAPVDPKEMLRLMKKAAKEHPPTKEEMRQSLIRAGIYTKKGNLTKRYRGGDDE